MVTGPFPFAKTGHYRVASPPGERGVQEPVMQNHNPTIVERPDGSWVLECRQCRSDRASAMPIGIGIPLRDRETVERLRENHSPRPVRAAS